MLQALLVVLYAIVCLFLIGVVLLQTGKRADLAGAFGGGGSQTAFGPRGAANLFTKLTTVSAVLFMLLALVLSILGSRGPGGGSVLDQVPGGTPAVETEGGAAAPDAGLPALPDDSTPAEEAAPAPADDSATDPDAP